MKDENKTKQQLIAELVENRQRAEVLEAERQRLFLILDELPAQVYLIAPDYSFRYSNRFFQERFGNSEGKPCYMVYHRRTEPCEQCTTFQVGENIKCGQGEFTDSDGNTYQYYDHPFTDHGTEVLLSFGLDITMQKKAEAALLQSQEKFSKAFHCNPSPMSITTLKEGRYIEVNDAYLKATGYKQNEIIGRSVHELGIWSVPEKRVFMLKQIKEQGSIRGFESEIRIKSGEIRTFIISGEIINLDGKVHLLNSIRDITNVKQIEVEMTRLDRLNVVGEMAASIGHEIRNPMTTVRGFLQILRENKDYQQEIEYFDLMIEELDRANSIITEFLSLAKNKMVELNLTSLNTIIGKLWPLVQAKAMSRDQHIKVELDDVPDLLLDTKEIRQLILNLVNNGMESMSSAGDVTIRTVVDQKEVVLSVQDQGHGIDCDLLDKIGTPFFTTKDRGTGLGLAVCYRIAARHNAKINIETSPTGTTFYVRFPSPLDVASEL